MKFVVTETGALLADLDRIEYMLLTQVADAADYTDSVLVRRRLFPEPVGGDLDGKVRREINEDWQEHVIPDLENSFRRALETFEADVANARLGQAEGNGVFDGQPSTYNVEIPMEHTDAWCSALNQARLALNEKYDLDLLGNEEEEDEAAIASAEWLARLQNEYYGMIQELLIRRLMPE